jgi:hypothetical protein
METPQPPQVSVSGQVRIEGQLHASPSSPQGPPSPPPVPPWWQFWRWRPEAVLAVATVVLAAATFLLADMAWKQTAILATTDESTRRAAEAAVKSAGAAETALKLTKEQQRPIIWLTNDLGSPQYVNLTNKPGGGQIAWAWHFTNYGRSPALRITFHQLIEIEGKTGEG